MSKWPCGRLTLGEVKASIIHLSGQTEIFKRKARPALAPAVWPEIQRIFHSTIALKIVPLVGCSSFLRYCLDPLKTFHLAVIISLGAANNGLSQERRLTGLKHEALGLPRAASVYARLFFSLTIQNGWRIALSQNLEFSNFYFYLISSINFAHSYLSLFHDSLDL